MIETVADAKISRTTTSKEPSSPGPDQNNPRTTDLVGEFETCYSQARADLAGKLKIWQYGPHDGANWLANYFRFRPAEVLLFTSCIWIGLTLGILWLVKHQWMPRDLRLIGMIVAALLAVCYPVLAVIIQVFSHRTASAISPPLRWQLLADKTLNIWQQRGHSVSCLAHAIRLRIFDMEQQRNYFRGVIVCLIFFVTLGHVFFGDGFAPFAAIVSTTQTTKLYYVALLVAGALYFVLLSVPLQWRRQLGRCLELHDDHSRTKLGSDADSSTLNQSYQPPRNPPLQDGLSELKRADVHRPSETFPGDDQGHRFWRFSVEQYHRMQEVGIINDDNRTELLEGWLVIQAPVNPPHATATLLTQNVLNSLIPSGWHLRSQLPTTTRDSEPEPDLFVVRGSIRDFLHRHPGPTDLALLIEVSDSTLRLDQREKKRLYARAGVIVYWVLNLPERRLEVYTDPSGPTDQPDYHQRQDFTPGEKVPVMLDGRQVATVSVADLLP